MVKLFTLSLTIFCLAACNNKEGSKQTLTGKEIFKKNCVLCHGINGDLMTNGAKNLNLSELPLEERILIISKGRNVMTGFEGKLTPREIQAVAEFTQTLRGK